MTTFACDTSYYQVRVDDRYPHPWFIYRVCDGTFIDPQFTHNHGWAVSAATRGKLVGHTAYCVFRPGVDVFDIVKRQVGTPPPRFTVMIDVESWGGQIRGDHSAAITNLVNAFASWLGSRDRVLVYANRWDFQDLYPSRPSWLNMIVAGYSSVQPVVPGPGRVVGWQYSDGEQQFPVPTGYPRASLPFGRCDHNVFPGLSPQQLASRLGVGQPAPVKPPVSNNVKEWSDMATKEEIRAVVREELDRGFKGPKGIYRPLWFLIGHPGKIRASEAEVAKANKKGRK